MPAIDPKGERPRRTTTSVQIYADLRYRIVTGGLRPLQCLSETELATSIGVSRTPIREALGKLEEEGLVEIRPRFGTFVSPIDPAAIVSCQFVREALECTAILDAASRCTPTDGRKLEAILVEQQSAVDEESFILADDKLHRTLMIMAGQQVAWNVVHTAKTVIDRLRYLSIQQMAKRQSVLSEHLPIIDRVIARDRAGAADAMRDHLRGIFISIDLCKTAHPEFFAWQEEGPRPNRYRPRQLREATIAAAALETE